VVKSGKRRQGDGFPERGGEKAIAAWLEGKPLQWSTTLATRAALRAIPYIRPKEALSAFRSTSIALISARYPNDAMDSEFTQRASEAAQRGSSSSPNLAVQSACAAADVAAVVSVNRRERGPAKKIFDNSAAAIMWARGAAELEGAAIEHFAHIVEDARLLDRGTTFSSLLNRGLWEGSVTRPSTLDRWLSLADQLRADGDHWLVWIDWYSNLISGKGSSFKHDLAFTDLPAELPWRDGSEAVNIAISARLASSDPDPAPLEHVISPITLNRKSDGRIGVEAGPFSTPALPPSLKSGDYENVLSACRSRATQLRELTSSPTFQGRSEYALILKDYLEWLPASPGTGNILLADGEARTLNKLYTADQAILPAVFASKLSVLLEDHIGLRSYYPEVERHYQAVKTGRLIKPLPHDAVVAIERVIRLKTPTVFDESVSPAITEAAKTFPQIAPPAADDLPPHDPDRPKPPADPIEDANPEKSRNYIVASAYNRIWSLLQKGKGTAEAIEGWQKTYDLIKPHIGPIIDFLKHFVGSDGSSGPMLPPTIGT
jgi:hypothetical protein